MSRYATDSDLINLVPGASGMSAAQREFALDSAESEIDDRVFGLKTLRAHVLLAAHYLALVPSSTVTGAGAVVASRGAGEVSVSYAVGAKNNDGPHSSTSWGRQFDELASTIASFPVFV